MICLNMFGRDADVAVLIAFRGHLKQLRLSITPCLQFRTRRFLCSNLASFTSTLQCFHVMSFQRVLIFFRGDALRALDIFSQNWLS